MRKLVLLLLVVIWSPVASAQKVQLGKVNVAELEQKRHPNDTSAAGAVLFSKGKSTFRYDGRDERFSAVHEYQIKIKVYKKEGLSLANFEIPYYIGFKELRPEMLQVNEAATYNLVNGKVQKTKVSGSAVFKEKVNEYWKTTTIVFPDVRVGSILELRYTLKSENIHAFPNFKFQREIPVDFAEYATEIPVNYQYKVIANGLLPIKTETVVRTGSQSFENQYKQTENLQYTLNVHTHSAVSMPAVKDEDFVDNADNYKASIDYELELIQFPNSPTRNFSMTWGGLVETIYKDSDFGEQMRKSDYFVSELKRLVANIESKQERMQKVFAFVQNRMNWNGFNGYFTRDGVEKAWNSQTGNIAEINLMLISMLNMAGVEAYPVLVSTVDHGVSSFPNQSSFNYVIAAAVVDGKKVLLDATNKFAVPGIVPTKTLNWNGRLVKRNGESEEIAMATPSVSKCVYSIVCDLAADGSMSGKSRVQLGDFAGLQFRDKFGKMNKESYLEYMEKSYEGIEISNYGVANEKRSADPIIETFDFRTANHAEVIGDKIYIDPLVFLGMRKNPFLADDRLMPIFFGYPKQSRYIVNIKIPAGYAVESLPEAMHLTTGGNVVSFKFAGQSQNNAIAISATYESGTMLVSQEFYPNIKNFFTQSVAKQNQKIVLKKI